MVLQDVWKAPVFGSIASRDSSKSAKSKGEEKRPKPVFVLEEETNEKRPRSATATRKSEFQTSTKRKDAKKWPATNSAADPGKAGSTSTTIGGREAKYEFQQRKSPTRDALPTMGNVEQGGHFGVSQRARAQSIVRNVASNDKYIKEADRLTSASRF